MTREELVDIIDGETESLADTIGGKWVNEIAYRILAAIEKEREGLPEKCAEFGKWLIDLYYDYPNGMVDIRLIKTEFTSMVGKFECPAKGKGE